LGAWQLSRAAGKEALQAQIDAQRRLPPLEADALQKGAPLHIRQNLDLAAFRSATQLPLLDLSVVQLGEPGEGMQRDWPVVSSGVDKHYGYAFQWFGLCGLIALLYVWFQIVRRFIRPRRERSS
jgi:cytochrome oxidase assembly protein ShyY1